MKRKLVYLALLVAGFGPILSSAQAVPSPLRPNFSGRWRMVKDKSNFATFHMPDMIIQQIDHHDPTLNIHTVETVANKTNSNDVSYFTDGKESENVISGRDASSKAFWDGPALMIRTETKDSRGENITMEDRYELSADKKMLTETSHITTALGGDLTMKLVCQRER
ncbi:MAG TPA: hypothetical protein VHZ07_10180 [Bryobacteraceae bacterium]|jgi:hypothetical protein|nr:hypothetical protein [Bryobacteraceae bacterium]